MAYSNSPLVSYTNISPTRYYGRSHAIDRITIHCAVAQWTAKTGCDYFKPASTKASCNYFVGTEGKIGLCVEEKDTSACSSSYENDTRAITIETASDSYHPYAVNAKAYAALLDLCEDICRRNGKTKMLWLGDKTQTLNYVPAENEMVMTVHRWFANKECPGQYLFSRLGEIASTVTARLNNSQGTTTTNHAKTIWNYLKNKIGNEYGVAGLMGNLYAESGLYPDRVQGDIPYSSYSQDYTAKVDNGTISEYDFVYNGPNGGGYGLAQWTYYTRKQALYDMYKTGGYSSIGSISLALDYLWQELEADFPGVVDVLKNASSIREASDKVLHDFENPADQSVSVEAAREDFGRYYFNLYATGGGGSIGGGDSPGGIDSPTGSFLSKLLLFAIAIDRN